MIATICCKCNTFMGLKDDGKEEVVRSHGYCLSCYYEELNAIDEFFNTALVENDIPKLSQGLNK